MSSLPIGRSGAGNYAPQLSAFVPETGEAGKRSCEERVAAASISVFTLVTHTGPVSVNSNLLKEKSAVFRAMLEGGLREASERTVDLSRYSQETLEYLVQALKLPPSSPLELPADNARVLELIDVAMRYDFSELIGKLTPAVSTFIQQHPKVVASANQAWLELLLPYVKHPAIEQWIAAMTPHLLEGVGIPHITPSASGIYKIPNGFFDVFLNEETRDLMQCLPVLLEFHDLGTFIGLCEKFKPTTPLPIKIICSFASWKKKKEVICEIGKRYNIEVSFGEMNSPKSYLSELNELKKSLSQLGVYTSREAIEWLKTIPKGELRHLDLRWMKIDPEDLPELLSGLTALETLKIDSANFTDKDLSVLYGLTQLNKLVLPPRISAAGLTELMSHLPQLKKLDLREISLAQSEWLSVAPQLASLTGLKLKGSQITDSVIQNLAPYLGNCESLTIVEGAVTDEAFKFLKLRELALIDCDEVLGFSLKNLASGLISLNLLNCVELKEDYLIELASQLTQMRHLSLNGPEVTDKVLHALSRALPPLESLSLTYCDQITDNYLMALFPLVKELKSLCIDSCSVTDRSIKALALNINHITSLTLAGKAFTDESLLALGPKLAGITKLFLAEGSFSDESWLKFVHHFGHIRELFIENCPLTDRSFIALGELRPPLVDLTLTSCQEITDESLKSLSRGFDYLNGLNLSKSSKITNQGLKAIRYTPRLSSLNLNLCRMIKPFQPNGLVSIFSKLPGLCRLDLGYRYDFSRDPVPSKEEIAFNIQNHYITNNSIKILGPSLLPLEHLTSLVLSGEGDVSERCMHFIKDEMPQLRHLEIAYRVFKSY